MTIIDTQRIADFLASHNLSSGIGTIEEPCSIAAINLALTGQLTDDIPGCMSEVIGQWIIRVQDAMPNSIRNYPGWKALLPLAAGTGRDPALERRRAELLLNWMWCNVLPQLQPIADEHGFGETWRTMLTDRTKVAAWSAAEAAYAAAYAAEAWAAAGAAAEAAAGAAAEAAARAAGAAAGWAEKKAAPRWATGAEEEFWTKADPVAMLKQLIDRA